MYSEESFAHLDLPDDLKQAMVRTANHSLAKKTWQSYKTANKHLEACQQETGAVFNLPLGEKDILLFTSWLIVRRGVRGSVCSNGTLDSSARMLSALSSRRLKRRWR